MDEWEAVRFTSERGGPALAADETKALAACPVPAEDWRAPAYLRPEGGAKAPQGCTKLFFSSCSIRRTNGVTAGCYTFAFGALEHN